MKATKKPVTIDFYTWEEVVKMGLEANPDSIHGEGENARAWNFMFHNVQLTHENNSCYIVPTLEGNHNFTPNDVLIIGVKGEVYPCKKDIFEMTYDIQNNALQGETFEDRLRKEFKELREKVVKLYEFIQKDTFAETVGEKQADYLTVQYQCMNSYLTILGIRMKELNIEIPQN